MIPAPVTLPGNAARDKAGDSIMATLAADNARYSDDQTFFRVTAILMALVLVGGFSTNLIMGRSTFAVPLIFHVHAVVFFGWVVLYVTQNLLATGGSLALHRRLGWLAVGWVPVMVVVGVTLMIHVIRTHGAPFFFDQNEFLFSNALGLVAFAALAGSAIALRRNTQWHRRLMFCAMAMLTGPGFGRLLPMPLMIPWAWWIAAFAFPVLFPLSGVIADWRRNGRVHPAWYWGIGAMAAVILLGDLIAYSPFGVAATEALVAGGPGADRPMHAYLP